MAPLDIKLELALNDTSLKYYPGDQVEGKIFITSNQTHRLSNLRLAWTGRISVQPIQANKDFRIYFDECWKLGPMLTKSSTKTNKGSSQVSYYHTQLIPVTEHSKEPKIDLPKNKSVGFTFKVTVPNDRALPSSTERSVLNSIIYLLEAFIDHETKPVFFAQRVVPVYEAIYTRTPDMILPQRAEQVFMVTMIEQQKEFTSAMRVTLPCRGCQPGIAIPVSITIWNNMEFSRKQGISISLLRVNHIIANGRTYTSPGEKVHRVVTDLNITSESNSNNNEKVQTVRIGLPIPKETVPTISIEKSQLLSVSYFIRVQVFAQEGIYTTSEGVKSQFMMVDIPFIIGTLTNSPTTPMASPVLSTFSPISSPIISSPKPTLLRNGSNSSSNKASPILSAGSLLTSSFSTAVTPKPSTSTSTSASASITAIASPELKSSSISMEPSKKNRLMSGMFRKTSSGSTHSSTDEKKKKSVFSTLRLYGRNINKEVSPAVIMTQADQAREKAEVNKDQAIVETANQDAGIFNVFRDDMSDCEQKTSVTPVVNEKVFKMFNDSDSDEEGDNDESLPEQNKESVSNTVFNMFPDSESDNDNDDANKIQVLGDHHQSELISSTETNVSASNLRLLSTHVFRMFGDSDSDDDEEEEVHEMSISVQTVSCLDGRDKPYRQNSTFKPRQIA